MACLKKRIINRFDMTLETFKKDLFFSKELAFLRMGDDLTHRIHCKRISNYLHHKKDTWILNYLEEKLSAEIGKYKMDDFCGEYLENAPIWICWWTGLDSAPLLVKQCVKSIRKHAIGHPVNFITQDNYKEFLSIPEYILDKLSTGKMCVANFTDYLRFSLLEKYGGIWLDATIYVSQDLPESYFANSIFTCKSQEIECRYISKFRWTSFCFGGWKGNVLFKFFKAAFEKYWKEQDAAVDYLLVDYIIDIASRNITAVSQQLEKVPINNLHRDDLQAAMNDALDETKIDDIINQETILYKLSWRETYSKYTEEGRKSIYTAFLDMPI